MQNFEPKRLETKTKNCSNSRLFNKLRMHFLRSTELHFYRLFYYSTLILWCIKFSKHVKFHALDRSSSWCDRLGHWKKSDIFPKTKMNLVGLSAAVKRSSLQNSLYEKNSASITVATPLNFKASKSNSPWAVINLTCGRAKFTIMSQIVIDKNIHNRIMMSASSHLVTNLDY